MSGEWSRFSNLEEYSEIPLGTRSHVWGCTAVDSPVGDACVAVLVPATTHEPVCVSVAICPPPGHEIKRCLLLGRKVMTDLDSILKSRDITLPTKVRLVKAMVFPVVMYGHESWTVKKAER